MKKEKVKRGCRFPIILLGSIIIGCILGLIFKSDAAVLKPFGDVFINMMFTIVIPLVFFTISSSIANMTSLKRLGKIVKCMLIVFVVTSTISALYMLAIVIFIDPVGNTNITMTAGEEIVKQSIGSQIVAAITVNDFSSLLSRSNMLPLIIFSCLFGFGVNLIGKEGNHIAKSLASLSKVMMKLIKIIMYYAPIGLCAYFAALIGEFGPDLLGSYAKSMGIYYISCVFFFIVFYSLYAYLSGGKLGVRRFYKNVMPVTVTSIATQSSLASLPTNLEDTEKIGVPKDVREITLPFGATIHMEGSAMAAILKIVFLFGIFGMSFTGMDNYLIAIGIAVLSGVVMAGIPGGGLIGEMLIVSLYGFPAAAFPIIATIGWLVDPPATCLNVVGDTSSSMLVSRLTDGKNWLKKQVFKEITEE